MNLLKPRTPKNVKRERSFDYQYCRVTIWSLEKIFRIFQTRNISDIMQFCLIIEKNTNVVLNTLNMPAESRVEMVTALKDKSGVSDIVSKRIIKKMFDEDIIRRVVSDSFTGYKYYFNPHIIFYGDSVNDNTLEIFADSKWNPDNYIDI